MVCSMCGKKTALVTCKKWCDEEWDPECEGKYDGFCKSCLSRAKRELRDMDKGEVTCTFCNGSMKTIGFNFMMEGEIYGVCVSCTKKVRNLM